MQLKKLKILITLKPSRGWQAQSAPARVMKTEFLYTWPIVVPSGDAAAFPWKRTLLLFQDKELQ